MRAPLLFSFFVGLSALPLSAEGLDCPIINSFSASNAFSAPGAPVTVSWSISDADSVSLNGIDVTGQNSASALAENQTVYLLSATNANGTTTEEIIFYGIAGGEFIISEFGANNTGSILDEEGNTSDWIEISNPSSGNGNLSGFYLTDDPDNLTKWEFPSTLLNRQDELLVFASGNDRTNPGSALHTNFNLSSDGEYLALVKPDGVTIASEFSPTYPNQRAGISYGYDASAQGHRYYLNPTPGSPNGTSIQGFVKDTSFSVDRGIYNSPIEVEITSDTPAAEIRYTLDGSVPDASSSLYNGTALLIDETTILRAIAFRSGFQPTNVDTQSYIFPSDVITQATMRTAITQDAVFGPQMIDALTEIPSISLSFESPEGNNINRTELPVSVELLNFEGGSEQVDAGAARYGSYVTDFAKRSIRLQFRGEYGSKKLNFPLFEGVEYGRPPVESFDSLDVRAGNHDMVHRGAYFGNRFADDALLDMGQVSPHGRFVHLYFNGEYRGMYHLRERWDSEMMSSYLPGEAEEYDTINANNAGREFKTGDLQDGDLDEWNELQTRLNQPNPYRNVKDLLDVENMIDFMILFTYGTCESEFRAGGSTGNGEGFKFMVKDADGFLQPQSGGFLPSGGFYPATHNGPLNSMTRLRSEADPEFMTLLADRAHQHFFNDGALTAEKSTERLVSYLEETRTPYLAEIARWASHDGRTSRTPSAWENYHQYFLNDEFLALPEQRITLMRNAGMYPDVDAPTFQPHGGALGESGKLAVSLPENASTVYVSFAPLGSDLSSADPRLTGGALNPAATVLQEGALPEALTLVETGSIWRYLDDGTDQGTAWRDAAFDDSTWESGPSQLGYGDNDEATKVGFIDIDAERFFVQKNATTYFRKSDISIPDPSIYPSYTINYLYDDGIAIYINGVEIDRQALAQNAAFDEFSTGGSLENETGSITINNSFFVPGDNTIAVEVHQTTTTNSDMSFDLELTATPPIGPAVSLNEPGWLLSRSFNSTTQEWSALNSAFFTLDTIPADASNLVISKIHYHPADAATAAELAVSTDRDDYEFIEILNVGSSPISLSGLKLSGGVEFSFGGINEIPIGERMIIPKDRAAFNARYSGTFLFATDILGEEEYSGRLSNNGEQLILTDASGNIIHDFNYQDSEPWPSVTDGTGYVLMLKSPFTLPDHSEAENWVASAEFGGSPGESADFGFIGNAEADLDGDGYNALLEYALSTSDADSYDTPITTSFAEFNVNDVSAEYFTFSFQRNQRAQNALLVQPEISSDLLNWTTTTDLVLISDTENGDGTATMLYRSANPRTTAPEGREFIRINVSRP